MDVLGSISRLRNDIIDKPDLEAGARLMRWLKSLEDNRDLVNIGAYVPGSDPYLDQALAKADDIRQFLTQGVNETSSLEETMAGLRRLTEVE